jgi:ABC-2 type transport system permease protein
MKKILLVARREYIATIRRKAFIILTIGMPVFFLILFGLSAIGGMLAARSEARSSLPVGIVDEAGVVDMGLLEKVRASFPMPKALAKGSGGLDVLRDLKDFDSKMALMRSQIEIRKFDRREDAKSAFLNKEIRGYYVVPPDFLKDGEIRLMTRKGGFLSDSRPAWATISRLLQASILEGKVNDDLGRRVWVPPEIESTQMSESGEVSGSGTAEEVADFAVPYFATLFFMISIIGTSGYLLQSVAEEKENRVIEVLISSVSTDQLLAGKVLGLCGAGLSQMLIWITVGVTPAAMTFPHLGLRWSQLVVALVFFLLGFLLFGTLMAGCGALGNNYRESQQLSMVWTMSAVSPFFVMTLLMQQPNGTLARVLSYIPLTAPVTMMLRTSSATVPAWDIALSAVILAASLFFFVRLGGKLFRVGVLMYGKRPSLDEIVRWLKAA